MSLGLRTIGCLVFVFAAGCGGDDDGGGAVDAANGVDSASSVDADPAAIDATPGVDAAPGVFSLTSSVLADGGVIPTKHSCQGANVSPPLAWTGAPAGTKSFAVVFTDISTDFLHSVIWDIPAGVASLPEAVENAYEPTNVSGAKQTEGYDRNTRGYLGPCPGSPHTYEFEIYALSVDTLPGGGVNSRLAAVVGALPAQSLGTATLSGTFDPN